MSPLKDKVQNRITLKNFNQESSSAVTGISFLRANQNNLYAAIKKLNLLTNEGKSRGQHDKHAIAVHCDGHGKIYSQATPNKELVNGCPVTGVKTYLKHISLS